MVTYERILQQFIDSDLQFIGNPFIKSSHLDCGEKSTPAFELGQNDSYMFSKSVKISPYHHILHIVLLINDNLVFVFFYFRLNRGYRPAARYLDAFSSNILTVISQ